MLLIVRVSSGRPFQVRTALGRKKLYTFVYIVESGSVLSEDCLDYLSYKRHLRLLHVTRVQIDK